MVAVTGAASGLGRALAVELGREGAALALADVAAEGLAETARRVVGSPRVTTDVVDVSDREAVCAWASRVEREHGGADALINNAGVAALGSLEELGYDDLEWVIGVDLWGVIHGVKAFLPLLRRRPEAHIVNISSINAFVPFRDNGPYNLSKAAVGSLSETLMLELSDTAISVTSVHPGGIKTDIVRNARHATGEERDEFERFARATPEQAARSVIRAMKRGRMRHLLGGDARLLDALKRLFPVTTVRLVGALSGRFRDRARRGNLAR